MKQFVCYCFEHTEDDIRRDVLENAGHSAILEKILTAKKQGACRCAEKHPERRCCAGDVRRVVDDVRKGVLNGGAT